MTARAAGGPGGAQEHSALEGDKPKRRHRALLCVLTGVLSLAFVRIYRADRPFIMQESGDDAGYFAHTEALLRFHTLDWCAAPFTSTTLAAACAAGRRPVFNKYTPGAALLVAPVTAAGLVADRLHLVPRLPLDPLLLWSAIGSALLLCGSALLLYAAANDLGCSPRRSLAATVAFLLGNPVLYFVYRRPLMAHSAELFLFWLAVVLFLRWTRAAEGGRRLLLAAALGCTAGLLAICRLNDFPMVLAFLLSAVVVARGAGERLRSAGAAVAGAIPPLLVFAAVVQAQLHGAPIPPYDDPSHFAPLWPPDLASLGRMAGFFVGIHWGICLLMPFMAIELAAIAALRRGLRSRLAGRGPLVAVWVVAVLAQLYFLAHFWTPGMSYGARYVFPIYYLVHLAFLLAIARARLPSPSLRRIAAVVAGLAVLVACLNLASIESSEALTMRRTAVADEGVSNPEFAGLVGWASPRFAAKALANAASGRAFLAFGASPAAAYTVFAVQGLFG